MLQFSVIKLPTSSFVSSFLRHVNFDSRVSGQIRNEIVAFSCYSVVGHGLPLRYFLRRCGLYFTALGQLSNNGVHFGCYFFIQKRKCAADFCNFVTYEDKLFTEI